MSLTSYRAAPPRVEGFGLGLGCACFWAAALALAIGMGGLEQGRGVEGVKRKDDPFFAGLATTYSPMS